MILRKICFDAYKSLLRTELPLPHNCVGLVGRNESGKTNILMATRALSETTQLEAQDAPKMERSTEPRVRFVFVCSPSERDRLIAILQRMLGAGADADASKQAVDAQAIVPTECTLTYSVEFDRKNRAERREFSISGLTAPNGALIRRLAAKTDACVLRRTNSAGEHELVLLSEVLLITKEELNEYERLSKLSLELQKNQAQLSELESELQQLTAAEASSDTPAAEETEAANDTDANDSAEQANATPETSPERPPIDKRALSNAMQRKQKTLSRIREKVNGIKSELGPFDLQALIRQTEDELEQTSKSAEDLQAQLTMTEGKLSELQATSETDEAQAKEVAATKKSATTIRAKLEKATRQKASLSGRLSALNEPLRDKFTDSPLELEKHVSALLAPEASTWLPKVVFWQYSPKFVLSGETEFSEITTANTFEDIPRPLVNIFRIGLNVATLDELKSIISEIESDSSERDRHADKLNKRITEYLNDVWPEYDQQIKISLERERIRIQFYDPKHSDAAYYKMMERSQGCQTFISFLLTIGAEAKRGVIRDTVLLLDEPETHLHPSGVRFMLQELIRVANNGNTVVFATHSPFMIDRENYDRHVVLKKQNERTVIQPSQRDRVGYFMQEEVLYEALSINLADELRPAAAYSFVFEGSGDAALFAYWYERVLGVDAQPYPQKNCRFYHGGKCNDIERFLARRPLQLGSTWVFVLDNDPPAEKLKAVIEKRYGDFLGSYIHVLQYQRDGVSAPEFEDLLPSSLVHGALHDVLTKESAVLDNLVASSVCVADMLTRVVERYPNFDKGAFKTHLNSRIAAVVTDGGDSAQFREVFSAYVTWAEVISGKLKAARGVAPTGGA